MRYLFILILASIASGFIPIIRTPVLSQRGLSLQALPACFAEDALAGGVSQSAVDAAVFAASSIRQGAPIATPFLDPADVGILLSLFNKLEDISVDAEGGYSRAEQKRLLCYLSSDSKDTNSHDEFGLAAIDIRGDFLFVPLTRDAVNEALRALLEPSQTDLIGDIILLGERGAQAVVASEIAPACLALNHVSDVPVTVSPLDLADLAVRPPSVIDVKAVEASMRLDAVGSAGLGISRSKLVGLVKKGEVTVNWRPVTSPSSKVRIGDVVAIRGSSKVEIISVEPTTKGKWRISLRRTS